MSLRDRLVLQLHKPTQGEIAFFGQGRGMMGLQTTPRIAALEFQIQHLKQQTDQWFTDQLAAIHKPDFIVRRELGIDESRLSPARKALYQQIAEKIGFNIQMLHYKKNLLNYQKATMDFLHHWQDGQMLLVMRMLIKWFESREVILQ